MKKLLIITTALLLLVSCSNPTKKIEQEFKQYVAQNFDSPKSVVEIVEVSIIDEISAQKKFFESSFDESFADYTALMGALEDHKMNVVFPTNQRIRRNSNDQRRVAQKWNEYVAILDKITDAGPYLLYYQTRLSELAEKLEKEPPIYIYQIKFRQSVDNEVKLRTYFATHSKSTKKTTFFDNLNIPVEKTINSSEPLYELALAYHELWKYMHILLDLYKQEVEIWNEVERINAKYK